MGKERTKVNSDHQRQRFNRDFSQRPENSTQGINADATARLSAPVTVRSDLFVKAHFIFF